MSAPTSSDAHEDGIMPAVEVHPPGSQVCSSCNHVFGAGYIKCPECLSEAITKFNPNQPRDALGKWTDLGGGIEGIADGSMIDASAHGVGVSASQALADKASAEAYAKAFANRETYAPSSRAVEARQAFAAVEGVHNEVPEHLLDIQADPEKARQIADLYLDPKLAHGADDPIVQAAYADLLDEVAVQKHYMDKAGIKVEYLTSKQIKDRGLDPEGLNPYATAQAQAEDIDKNKHLMIASIAEYTDSHHPILDNSQGGTYDQFRAVHDFYGHASVGTGFDRHGEYQAWVAHMSMFKRPGARAAASSELTGENSTLIHLPGGMSAPHRAAILPTRLVDPIVEHGVLIRKAACSCGTSFGPGYIKCPSCLTPVEDVLKMMGFGKFPRSVPLSGGTVWNPDPRLHSHAFDPDPTRPSKCKVCGMGTGTHGRMKPKEIAPPDPDDPESQATSKSTFRRLLDKAADLLIPQSTSTYTLDDTDGSVPIIKSALMEKRFSMAPVYLPNTYDAHGEFIDDPDMLQQALWGYVESTGGDRTVYLQHSPTPAGKWVEVMQWPFEVTTQVTVPGEVKKSRTVTLPAGTVYMGVIWEPWAAEEVRKGKLRGFSLGGRARHVTAVIEEPINPFA